MTSYEISKMEEKENVIIIIPSRLEIHAKQFLKVFLILLQQLTAV